MIVRLAFDAKDRVLDAELAGAPRTGEMIVAGDRCFVVQYVVWYVADESHPPACVAIVAESDIELSNVFGRDPSVSPDIVGRRRPGATEH